jgi:hypothetical protein
MIFMALVRAAIGQRCRPVEQSWVTMPAESKATIVIEISLQPDAGTQKSRAVAVD